MPRTPNLSKICPDDCFSGLQEGGPEFVKNLKICPEIVLSQIFDNFLTNLGPPDWSPEKQSSGQIFDKFGVRGIFECCKGPEGSQSKEKKSQIWSPKTSQHSSRLVTWNSPRARNLLAASSPLCKRWILNIASDRIEQLHKAAAFSN